jgi:hypothetical protein
VPHIWATQLLANGIFSGKKQDQTSKMPNSLPFFRLVGNHQEISLDIIRSLPIIGRNMFTSLLSLSLIVVILIALIIEGAFVVETATVRVK